MVSRETRARAALLRQLLASLLTLDNAKSLVFYYLVYSTALQGWRTLRARGVVDTLKSIYLSIVQRAYSLLLKTPQGRKKLASELAQARSELTKKLILDKEDPVLGEEGKTLVLPKEGKSREWMNEMFDRFERIKKSDWEKGRVSGAVYHGHSEGTDLGGAINEAIQRYLLSNPLHPDVFPGVRRMEAEVISMVLNLFNADMSKAGGTTTSGGTESIVMACKAYRDYARAEKGITKPEMIIPISAHAAFDKAGQYFGIKIHHIPVDPVTRKVNLKRVKRAINANTILLVGSAPNFPDGIIDPIPELSELAVKYKIPLHVDCCLGSFIVPFLEKAGYPVGLFDFRLPGVTSISCDTHKYGFAPKGSSIIMYSDRKYRHYQFFVTSSWPGGVYASPSLAGSRPGAILAGAWAAMTAMGEQGYLESCRAIVGAARELEKGVREIEGLQVLGNPMVTVVAFKSDEYDVLQVGDAMSEKGWHLNALQNPPSLHICCTRLTVPIVPEFLTDLKASVEQVRALPAGSEGKGTMVQIYGLGSSPISGPFIISEFVKVYLDVLYEA